MDNNRSFVFVVFVLIREVKSDWELEIELNRGTLETSSQGVKDGDVNFRTVKRAVSRVEFPLFPARF